MGVDAITMADNPVATLHMGNLGLAKIVQDEAEVPVVLHLTCRDHNLLGLQSRLLESQVLGVHHILALTGDPARVGDMPGATSVYDMQSFGLVELISRFNRGQSHAGTALGSATTFTIGVAFNPNGTARHLAHHVERLRKKVRAGAHFAMTQPIYDPTRFPEMMRATADLGIPILVGIMPVLSERNAEYLHNEVPGIVLTDEVRRRMKGLSGKEGKRVGLEICKELIDAMPDADGFYLIPPQRSTEMAVELVEHINRRVPAAR
jgi:homocysteine S-methyltransferase